MNDNVLSVTGFPVQSGVIVLPKLLFTSKEIFPLFMLSSTYVGNAL